MKKVFMILATLAVASLTLSSCKKDDPKDNPGKDDPGKEDPGKEDPKDEALTFAIDGDFSDWDALTADKVDDNNVIMNAVGDAKALKVMKVSSDEANIYLYAEVAVDKIQQSATAFEGGNSNDGHGAVNEAGSFVAPGPLTVYWDLDGDASTGFIAQYARDAEAPFVPGVGCECGSEMYLFIDTKDGKCKLGWSQLVYEPDGAADGDLYQTDWWGADYSNPVGGWDPNVDNLAPSIENYATEVGSVLKIEWSVEKNVLASLCKRGHNMGKTINIGATWNNGDAVGSFVYGLGIVGPATVTLK